MSGFQLSLIQLSCMSTAPSSFLSDVTPSVVRLLDLFISSSSRILYRVVGHKNLLVQKADDIQIMQIELFYLWYLSVDNVDILLLLSQRGHIFQKLSSFLDLIKN